MATVPASLENYLYELPDDKIAKHPLANRDDSKLLFYQKGEIVHQEFKNAVDLVPEQAVLFLNNTKVIAARLFFQKDTGAQIEIFLTEPVAPYTEFQKALKVKKQCTWRCMIGNLKKWKDENILSLRLNEKITIEARLVDRLRHLVEFTWKEDAEFLDIIESAGHVPLPPYLNREEEAEDKKRYQTVFSELEGAVAAPTAGLHFTDDILSGLEKRGVKLDCLTLHVSAGTFRPIQTDDFKDHDMHNERIIIQRQNITHILEAAGPVIPVGTTALRTLESLYWYGVKLVRDPNAIFKIDKGDPYEDRLQGVSLKNSMEAILAKMDHENKDELKGETEIFIYPEYEFKVAKGLFTNFHMPGSTLILLVAAFVGKDWEKIYQEALNHGYRFLSYGDTSLLLP